MPEHTGFRITDKECNRNDFLIFKKQHWRSPVKKLEEEPGNKITGQAGKDPRKGKTKTYLDKPSLWFKRMILRKQKDVFRFEFGLIVPAVLKCLILVT